ncbi:metal ABC transporter solute-binding protein, Zn/Mn family [Paenibacillus protaetiae]|uniref:ABC transporter substrate-binding protein n=1 Tax=Paenibacillus protaetiae TaxID=2509456 RepID=A0A4P6EUC9_9BACL|nr:zinc ABC transporter substrate-binding protein [Paenibacillus protaetiae]QAY66266.1 ABC transporter substrate-binding protein [Paenibacillus protaetiae]
MFQSKANRKRAAAVIAAAVMFLMLSACGVRPSEQLDESKTNVVTTFYPLYYLASQIGGDDVHVINLVPAGVEPHDWTPKSRDIEIASEADLFLYNGAGLENWVDHFLKGLSSDSKVKTAAMSEGIALLEGSGEEEDEHGHAHDEGENGSHTDPHTWVSPKSMLIMANHLKNKLIAVDPSHQEDYEANYAKLKQKLEELDARYTSELATVSRKDIVVSHQAFGYLARDYGLKQVAIMGLSPDAEPRSQDIMRIIHFVKDNRIKYIFSEELISPEIAKMLASEAHVGMLVLNPLEGLTPKQEKQGQDFISIMYKNLDQLMLALK